MNPVQASTEIGNTGSWAVYTRLLGYSRKYWPLFLLGILGMALDAGSTAAFTALLQPLMDEGFLAENWHSVRLLPLWTILIFAGRGLGTLTSTYAMTNAGRSVIFDLRQALFDKLLKLPSAFYDRHGQGQLIAKLTFNVEQVANASTDALTILVRDTFYILGFLGVMFYYSVQMTLTVMLIAPLLAMIAAFVSRRFRKLSRRIQGSVGDVAHRATEVVAGHQVVKLFGAQASEHERFRAINRDNRRQHLKLVLTKSGSAAVVHVIAGLALAGIIYLATSPDSGMTPGSFIAFVTAMLAILPSLRRLTNVLETVQKGVAAAESVFEVLDQADESDHGRTSTENLRGEVAFENVSLTYPAADTPAISDISFVAKPGTTTAIVGRSGSGKSTLVSLLPRFYQPGSGRVLVDGVDVADYPLESLRGQVAVVSQRVVLFNDTIASNIAYGSLESMDASRVEEAAKRAGASAFINDLPNGLQTRIGSEGLQLSGGERQRIAIARAVLLNAPILVLDEATSALDTHTERDVYEALKELSSKRTTLVIAHRLSTVENADQVIVMEKGRIVEQGTHAELIKLDGAYAGLHRMQFRDAEDSD
jgi:subfamily B ATP-binding cassette protein MsbA